MDDLELLKRELFFEAKRCTELFNTQIFIKQTIFTQSAFIEILIRLNYILQDLNKNSCRITWDDNIQTHNKIKDITDLVNNFRNAACHSDSPRNFISDTSIKFVFNTIKGKCQNAIKIGKDISLGCEYEDDIAYYYGNSRIYLIRHIKKLLEELPDKISKLK